MLSLLALALTPLLLAILLARKSRSGFSSFCTGGFKRSLAFLRGFT